MIAVEALIVVEDVAVISVGVKLLTPTAKMPTKAYDSDSGFDLYADKFRINEYGVLEVSTGIALSLPSGYQAKIRDKSGIGRRGTHVLGGIIDESYTGEIIVLLNKHGCSILDKISYGYQKDWKIGEAYPYFHFGSKIAQLIISKREDVKLFETNVLPETSRGDKGFGSSGT